MADLIDFTDKNSGFAEFGKRTQRIRQLLLTCLLESFESIATNALPILDEAGTLLQELDMEGWSTGHIELAL